MSYNSAFSHTFELGFKIEEFPVKLVDRSYQNDICPSFYFQINDEYFILWVDYKNKELREDPESYRYSIAYAINEGDEKNLEISEDSSKTDILCSDNFLDVKRLILEMLK